MNKNVKIYLTAMAFYWFVFGLITIFYPPLMDLFQTSTGMEAGTEFSDHVWLHGGLDIIALCILLFGLTRENISRGMIKMVALAALMPTLAISYSLLATPYWNSLFIGAGLGCFAFVLWGLILAYRLKTIAKN